MPAAARQKEHTSHKVHSLPSQGLLYSLITSPHSLKAVQKKEFSRFFSSPLAYVLHPKPVIMILSTCCSSITTRDDVMELMMMTEIVLAIWAFIATRFLLTLAFDDSFRRKKSSSDAAANSRNHRQNDKSWTGIRDHKSSAASFLSSQQRLVFRHILSSSWAWFKARQLISSPYHQELIHFGWAADTTTVIILSLHEEMHYTDVILPPFFGSFDSCSHPPPPLILLLFHSSQMNSVNPHLVDICSSGVNFLLEDSENESWHFSFAQKT